MSKTLKIALLLLLIGQVSFGQIRIQTSPGKHMGCFYDENGFLSQDQLDSLKLSGFDYKSFSRMNRPLITISNILIYGGVCLCFAGEFVQDAEGYPDGEVLHYNKKSLYMFIPGAAATISGVLLRNGINKRLSKNLIRDSSKITLYSSFEGFGVAISLAGRF